MRNRYFKDMQRAGTAYRKGKPLPKTKHSFCPPYSEGQSFAFKFWSIADRYNSTQIVVDDLPEESQIPIMIATFKAAGIEELFVAEKDDHIAQALKEHGCTRTNECKAFRRETELYDGELEIISGSLYKVGGKYV